MRNVMRMVAVLACLTAPLSAQENVDRQVPPVREFLRQAGTDTTLSAELGSRILPRVWCGDVDDEETQARCWEAYRASLDYYATGLEHRARVFAWQHLSTRVIFFVVLGLVAVGIYFAWAQFQRGLSQPMTQTKQATEVTAVTPSAHELEISPKGIRVSSPVLGVVILALSLAFFYLYLVYVYPIREIF